MSHSPHSSLSTPTPSSLGLPQMQNTPRAPPTPPDSVGAPTANSASENSNITASPSPSSLLRIASSSFPNFSSTAFESVVSSPREVTSEPVAAPLTLITTSQTQSALPLSSPPSQPNVLPSSSPLGSTAPSVSSSNHSNYRSSTPSPSSSRYHSPFVSPSRSTRSNLGRTGTSEDNELDDSESSDVEIYLNGLGLDNSASRTQVDTEEAGSVPADSPVLPASSQSFQTAPRGPTIVSPKIPSAPTQQTIPLPDVYSDSDRQPNTLQSHTFAFHDINHRVNDQAQFHQQDDFYPELNPSDPNSHSQFESSQKTPNVYINGLPPHFPEDQLFALTSPFGEIRSVRTFTRHVRDSESGYGFVLFETIEAAERCIMSLRRYRNLHPTFSKQIHKIPGTMYAHTITTHTPSGSVSSLGGWEQESRGNDARDASFKAKMESLHDPTSTNLYMEGLPLSIDEPTLAALVSPHRISSSRFFQTRLSNPPRIIAFVRLETREGAEEIIERLHGRMVRGWNDSGSRISVRFADTAEQRELRRSEKAAKEGDESPARLTIAQAALLNLRGQELRDKSGPVIHTTAPLGIRNSHTHDNLRSSDFQSNANTHASSTGFAVDYSLAPSRSYADQRAHSPFQPGLYQGVSQPIRSQPSPHPPIDPAMVALLENLRGSGIPFNQKPRYIQYDNDYQIDTRQQIPAGHTYTVDDPGYQRPPKSAHTSSGYTATEEYIMRAHAESQAQRRKPIPLDLARRRRDHDANIGMGVRGYRAQASAVNLVRQHPMSPTASMAPLPPMSEEDFHANAASRNDYRQNHAQQSAEQEPPRNVATRHNHNIHPAHVNARLSRDLISRAEHSSTQQQQIQEQFPFSPDLSNAQHYQHAHTRASTLPHRSSNNQNQHQRHYQHSSMSIPPKTSIRTPQLSNTSVMSKNISISNVYDREENSNNVRNNNSSNYDSKARYHGSSRPVYQDSNNYDVDQTSPSLISPTLTYSSHTPLTLSPATPFFGSFNDGFERNISGPDGKKMKAAAGHQ